MKQTSTHAQAAKLIRQFLKANNIDGRVTSQSYSMGNSINVRVADLDPTRLKVVELFSAQFEYGSFNGMTDCYEYDNKNDDIPQVKFVFVNNEMSNEVGQDVWDFARRYFSGMNFAPSDYANAGSFYIDGFDMYGNQLVWKLYSGQFLGYWEFKGNLQKAA